MSSVTMFPGLDPVKQPTEIIRGLWQLAAPSPPSQLSTKGPTKDFGVQRFFMDLVQSGVEVCV
jgi:hypothetical protein